MKKIFILLFLCLITFSFAEDIQVKVSIKAESNSLEAEEELETETKKAAIKKHIKKLDSQVPSTLIEKAVKEYSNFIDDIDNLSQKWNSLGNNVGQLTGEYSVSVKADKINKWLKKNGYSSQGKIELTIMEEPPSLGQMKLDKVFGVDVNGTKFFIQNYTRFQRNLRDAIVKKVGNYGFDVKFLANNDLYEKFKSKDDTLLGVFFDVNSNNFVVDRDLLKEVKANNPDTLVLYYRVDTLIFNAENRKIRASIALNIKNLKNNVTYSIGSQTFQYITRSTQKDEIIDDISYCATAAMNSLINSEDGVKNLNDIIMSIKNSAKMSKGPIRLIVNTSTFDKKIQKRVLWNLKKEMIAKKITSSSNIEISGTTLTATIDNKNITASDDLYWEYIEPIFQKLGVELNDDKFRSDGNTLTIRP